MFVFSTIATGLLKRYGQTVFLTNPIIAAHRDIPTPRGGGGDCRYIFCWLLLFRREPGVGFIWGILWKLTVLWIATQASH